MMSVHCAYCGEELMGAVNRCWRCGRRFQYAPTPESEPPVRRSPIAGALHLPPASVSRYGFETAGGAALVDALPAAPSTPAVEATAVEATLAAAPTADPPPECSAEIPAAGPAVGRLRQVDQSEALRFGSPFDPYHRLSIAERARIGGRWFLDNLHALRRNWLRRRGNAAAKKRNDDPALSPLRKALANSSLALSLILTVLAWCLTQYELIAVAMAILGLGLTVVSALAAPRWRVAVPAFLCALLLLMVTTRSYHAWQRQQLVQQGLLPAEAGGDDDLDEENP